MKTLKYTVIINSYPNKDRAKNLIRCLRSLDKQTYPNFSILIIENYKDNIDLNRIVSSVKLHKKVEIITDPTKKLSFLFNLGWKKSKTEMLAYLADDAEADKNWLQEINMELDMSKKTGACSGPIISTCYPAGEMHRLYLLSQSSLIMKIVSWPYLHFALEGRVLDPGILLESGAYSLGASLAESKKYPTQEIDLLTTSSMGIRRSALQKIKGFNENYFFNHADGDLFIRLKIAGYKLIFNPKIIAKHHLAIGPSRNAYFIGRDTGRFYRDHIHPRSIPGQIGAFLNLLTLHSYWILSSIKQKSLQPLSGIIGFIKGRYNFS